MKQFAALLWVLVASLLAAPAHAQSGQRAVCATGTGTTHTPQALAADAQGNTYVVGTMNGNVHFGRSIPLNSTGDSGFVGKLNAAGQWQWVSQVPLGSTSGEFLCQAAVADAAGTVYVADSGNHPIRRIR